MGLPTRHRHRHRHHRRMLPDRTVVVEEDRLLHTVVGVVLVGGVLLVVVEKIRLHMWGKKKKMGKDKQCYERPRNGPLSPPRADKG